MSGDAYVHTTMELSGLHTLQVIQDRDPMDPLTEWDSGVTILHWHPRYTFGKNPWGELDMGVDRSDRRVYVIGVDRAGYTYEKYLSLEEIGERLQAGGHEAMPVYLYDHSGITMSTRPFSCPWDSGQVGFAVMSADKIKKDISIYRKGFSAKRREEYTRFRTCTNEFPIGDKQRKVWTEWFNADAGRWTIDEFWWTRHVRITAEDREIARDRIKVFVEEYDKYLTGDVWGVTIDDEDGNEIEGCWGYFGIDYVENDVIPNLLKEYELVEEDHESQHERIKAEADEEIESMIQCELGLTLA